MRGRPTAWLWLLLFVVAVSVVAAGAIGGQDVLAPTPPPMQRFATPVPPRNPTDLCTAHDIYIGSYPPAPIPDTMPEAADMAAEAMLKQRSGSGRNLMRRFPSLGQAQSQNSNPNGNMNGNDNGNSLSNVNTVVVGMDIKSVHDGKKSGTASGEQAQQPAAVNAASGGGTQNAGSAGAGVAGSQINDNTNQLGIRNRNAVRVDVEARAGGSSDETSSDDEDDVSVEFSGSHSHSAHHAGDGNSHNRNRGHLRNRNDVKVNTDVNGRKQRHHHSNHHHHDHHHPAQDSSSHAVDASGFRHQQGVPSNTNTQSHTHHVHKKANWGGYDSNGGITQTGSTHQQQHQQAQGSIAHSDSQGSYSRTYRHITNPDGSVTSTQTSSSSTNQGPTGSSVGSTQGDSLNQNFNANTNDNDNDNSVENENHVVVDASVHQNLRFRTQLAEESAEGAEAVLKFATHYTHLVVPEGRSLQTPGPSVFPTHLFPNTRGFAVNAKDAESHASEAFLKSLNELYEVTQRYGSVGQGGGLWQWLAGGRLKYPENLEVAETRRHFFSCSEGSTPHAGLFTPGGDIAEFALLLQSVQNTLKSRKLWVPRVAQMGGIGVIPSDDGNADWEFSMEQVSYYFQLFLRQARDVLHRPQFYMHSSETAMEAVRTAALEAGVSEADVLHPRTATERNLYLDLLSQAEHQGCRHLQRLMTPPAEDAENAPPISPTLVRKVVKVFFSVLYDGMNPLSDMLVFDVHPGGDGAAEEPGAPVGVLVGGMPWCSERPDQDPLAPLLVANVGEPSEGDISSAALYHIDDVWMFRRDLAAFMAAQFAPLSTYDILDQALHLVQQDHGFPGNSFEIYNAFLAADNSGEDAGTLEQLGNLAPEWYMLGWGGLGIQAYGDYAADTPFHAEPAEEQSE